MRFTIREVLLLIAFVAMGLGWWTDRTRSTREYTDTIDVFNKAYAQRDQYMRSRLDIVLEKEGFRAGWDGKEWKLSRIAETPPPFTGLSNSISNWDTPPTPNDPSSSTAATGRGDFNRDGPPPLAAAYA